MMALGFPQGLSANPAGFPILRSGRVASYPLGPSTAFPTFLLDFRVFPGNSGGPVWLDESPAAGVPDDQRAPLHRRHAHPAGEQQRSEPWIGIVTHAQFMRETLSLLDLPDAVPATRQGAQRRLSPRVLMSADRRRLQP